MLGEAGAGTRGPKRQQQEQGGGLRSALPGSRCPGGAASPAWCWPWAAGAPLQEDGGQSFAGNEDLQLEEGWKAAGTLFVS